MAGGVYWTGTDGNVWVKDPTGTKSIGAYSDPRVQAQLDPTAGIYGRNATQIADPNPGGKSKSAGGVLGAMTSAGGSTGGGGAVGGGTDREAVSYWDDTIGSLQRLVASSNTQKDQGLASLTNSYNRNLSDTNEQESQTLRNYGIKRQDTQQNRQGALRQIDTSARQGNEGLNRLFQLSGSAGGSAATMVAPNAVARDASTKRTGTLETFGRNIRDLDLAEGDAKGQFSRARRDLDSQKREKEQSFIEGILNLQNDLNSKLSNAVTQRGIAGGGTYSGLAGARAQYTDAIRGNQNALDNLFNQYRDPQFNVAPVNAKVPDLAQYTVDPTALDLQGQNPGIPEELLPYLPGLKEEDSLRALLG